MQDIKNKINDILIGSLLDLINEVESRQSETPNGELSEVLKLLKEADSCLEYAADVILANIK